MNQRDQSEIGRSKASQGSMQTGAGPGQSDDKGSIMSGSPTNLVLVAVVVGLLFFTGVVFFIAASFADSGAVRDDWGIAKTILSHIATAIFSAGVLVGLGTVATARSKGASQRSIAVASLVSKPGIAVIILGVAEAICMLGTNNHGPGWEWGRPAK